MGRYQLEVKRVNEEIQERVESNLISKQSAEADEEEEDIDEKIPL
jgi:hypothetical protein